MSARDQDRLRARLRSNAADLGRVDREREKLRARRIELIHQADDAGLSVIEISELCGISRQAVYDALNDG